MLHEVKLPNLRGVNRGLHVLLVEDDDDDAMMLERILRDDRRVSEVWRVRDGEEADAFMDAAFGGSDQQPDLVLADVSMPRKNGFEFVESLRAKKAGRFTPVAMLTSSNRAIDYHRALLSRANTFITKPSSYDELAAVLKRLIRAFIWQDSLPPLFGEESNRAAAPGAA
jgi:CheY-like chemotaxis protein